MQATVKKYGFITLCCIPFALAFNAFYAPNGLTCGGFTGIGQIVNHFLPFAPVGTVTFLLNLPLFLLGLKRHGRSFLLSSLYATAVSSLFVDLLAAVWTFPPMEPLLACIYGGVILGVSLGGLLRYETTTGGTELGARLLLPRFPHLPIGKICLVMDLAVIASYAVVFGSVLNALYGGVALYLTTVVMDMVVYGGRRHLPGPAGKGHGRHHPASPGGLYPGGAAGAAGRHPAAGDHGGEGSGEGAGPRRLPHRLRREGGPGRGLQRVQPRRAVRDHTYRIRRTTPWQVL